MNDTLRFAAFLAVVLTVWFLMNAYVGIRLATLAQVFMPAARRWVWVTVGCLAASYVLGRVLDRFGMGGVPLVLEWLGAQWMGVLFLLLTALLVADLVTGFGFAAPRLVVRVRVAALACASALAVLAIAQGHRAPAVNRSEVHLPGLPMVGDGLKVAHLSDLHLGSLLGTRWLAARIAQTEALRPDLIVITGDLVDGDSAEVERLLPLLRTLHAPLGVFAVTGNHEFYAGLDRSVALLASAGFRVLRDAHVEVTPGLVLAGVDDLTARKQFGLDNDPISRALQGRPAGATILLSHTPWRGAEAAAGGVSLMLCGHTHDGQIWPFGYLVRLQYPHVGGSSRIDGMTMLVSRGTGTWGPRMRLFRRSEINLITLRTHN